MKEEGINIDDVESDMNNCFLCSVCGKPVDMRDLGEVFYHEHDDTLPDLRGKDIKGEKV